MRNHIKGCGCGAPVPQRVIDRAREANRKVADGTYRSLDLAALSDADFELWLDDKSAFGKFDGFTISGLPRAKLRKALFGREPASGTLPRENAKRSRAKPSGPAPKADAQ